MNVDQLELGNPTHQHRVRIRFAAQGIHQFGHHDGHIMHRRRRVDGFTGCGVDHVILDFPVLARCRRAASDPFYQPLVNFTDKTLRDRVPAGKVFRNAIKGLPVIQEFSGIVRVGLGDKIACEESLCLIQGQPRPFDMAPSPLTG